MQKSIYQVGGDNWTSVIKYRLFINIDRQTLDSCVICSLQLLSIYTCVCVCVCELDKLVFIQVYVHSVQITLTVGREV
jgi:hypothetical protein